jgi:hypothetical protein
VLCKICNEDKDLSNFYKYEGTDKYKSGCKQCRYLKDREYIINNRVKKKEYDNRYYLSHISDSTYKSNIRCCMKINATPPWLTDEQKKDIKNLYFECKIISDTTGVKHHIDHIIPLNNELVCGLHVPWNLQILTAKDNLIKSNII